MKLLLIIVLVGAAVATVEKVEPVLKSAADPVEVVAGIPGLKAFQYNHPGFVQKYEVKKFVSGPLTYSVKSAVPTKLTAPTIKAVGFTPLFTGPDALFTTDAEESDKPIAEEYSADSTVDAVAPVDKTEVVEPEFPVVPTYIVPNHGFAPSVYSVAGGIPAVGWNNPSRQVYTGSNRVYASPTVYSSPFFYHNQGIVPAVTTN